MLVQYYKIVYTRTTAERFSSSNDWPTLAKIWVANHWWMRNSAHAVQTHIYREATRTKKEGKDRNLWVASLIWVCACMHLYGPILTKDIKEIWNGPIWVHACSRVAILFIYEWPLRSLYLYISMAIQMKRCAHAVTNSDSGLIMTAKDKFLHSLSLFCALAVILMSPDLWVCAAYALHFLSHQAAHITEKEKELGTYWAAWLRKWA